MRRIDDLQVGGLKLLQDTDLFCFGCDAVELANFCGENKPKTVCDLGAGNGIISVLLAGKYGAKVTAVEIQSECAQLIRENAQLNNLDIEVINCPMQEFSGRTFDAVALNPPYRKCGSGMRQSASAVEIARHEICVTLSQAVACAARLLSTGGKLYLIQQTERLAETIGVCKQARLEPKILQVLSPTPYKPPHLFMLQCMKDGAEGIRVLPQREVRS